MTDLARERADGVTRLRAGVTSSPWIARLIRTATRLDPFDAASLALLAVLFVLVLVTFRDYAITNDEWIQHRYGELIVAYYKSGFTDRSVFGLDNLYLYGGLFDIVAVLLSHVVALDAFDLRHLMCAMTGDAALDASLGIRRRSKRNSQSRGADEN